MYSQQFWQVCNGLFIVIYIRSYCRHYKFVSTSKIHSNQKQTSVKSRQVNQMKHNQLQGQNLPTTKEQISSLLYVTSFP